MANSVSTFAYINMGSWRIPDHLWLSPALVADCLDRWTGTERAQNIGHLLPNSLIPLNSVRMSHLIETASSTFVFGLIMTWLLYPKYTSKKSYSS